MTRASSQSEGNTSSYCPLLNIENFNLELIFRKISSKLKLKEENITFFHRLQIQLRNVLT